MLMYTKTAGNLAFAAPERLVENCVYSEKVDIWAAGIVLVMLLTGKHPFETTGMTVKLIEDIMRGQEIVDELMFGHDDISEEAKDLVHMLLTKNPAERCSASVALLHPWFSKQFQEASKPALLFATRNMQFRRELKIQYPEEFQQKERIPMAALTQEILKYGLDAQEDKFYQKHHSVIFEEEILEMFQQQTNNASAG